MAAKIRLATEADAPAVQAIYAPYVQNTAISFERDSPDVETMRERIHKGLTAFPWLVCGTGAGDIAGYVYATKHRERAAYQWSVDVTVYIDPHFHRLGIGRGLYTSLFQLLRMQGFYHAYAGVTLPNDGSVGLHTALGFQPVGVYQGVGYKLGTWHDVSWWSLLLQPLPDKPAAPRPLPDILNEPEWQTALTVGLSLVRL